MKLAGAGDAVTSSTGVSVALAASAGEAERAGSAEEGEDNQPPHAQERRLGTRVPVAGRTRPDMGALLRRAPPYNPNPKPKPKPKLNPNPNPSPDPDPNPP